jgi:hypothetical protein
MKNGTGSEHSSPIGLQAHCCLSVVCKQNTDDPVSVARFAFDLKLSSVPPEHKAGTSKVKNI